MLGGLVEGKLIPERLDSDRTSEFPGLAAAVGLESLGCLALCCPSPVDKVPDGGRKGEGEKGNKRKAEALVLSTLDKAKSTNLPWQLLVFPPLLVRFVKHEQVMLG